MNARDYSALPVGKVAPKPHGLIPADFLVPARANPDYEAMDWTAEHAQTKLMAQVRATAQEASDLEDVRHEMRVEWQHALANMHALSTPKLPTVDGGKIVMVPVTELVGTLMDTNHAVSLLCDALRTGDMTPLHVHLRQLWLDGYSEELASMGWTSCRSRLSFR